jgi:hypothetical protein
MDDHILAIYCVCHDFLKALHHWGKTANKK